MTGTGSHRGDGVYRITAINDAVTSENRMHDDSVAQQFGFVGALVSGVSLFGYLTHPLVSRFGSEWFSGTEANVTFLKPAYANQELQIELIPQTGETRETQQVTARNVEGTLLATLDAARPGELPEPDEKASWAPSSTPPAARPEIHWDRIQTGQPAALYTVAFSPAIQAAALTLMRDTLPVYQQPDAPLVHPYLLLKECNQALMRLFVLPAWIHVGSRCFLRQPVHVGDTLEVLTVPMEKWERKGHQFIRLYIAFKGVRGLALEVWHTAIFRIAGARTPG